MSVRIVLLLAAMAGRFQVFVNGEPLAATFGTTGAEWSWHAGGTIELPAGDVQLALHDLTSFDGRCDCVVLSTEASPPPDDAAVLAPWRRAALGLPDSPETKGPYDLVVAGDGLVRPAPVAIKDGPAPSTTAAPPGATRASP